MLPKNLFLLAIVFSAAFLWLGRPVSLPEEVACQSAPEELLDEQVQPEVQIPFEIEEKEYKDSSFVIPDIIPIEPTVRPHILVQFQPTHLLTFPHVMV